MAGGRWDCTQCWWPKEPTEYLYASDSRWVDERMERRLSQMDRGGSRVNCGAGWIEGLVLPSLGAGWISQKEPVPPTGFEQFVTDSVTG